VSKTSVLLFRSRNSRLSTSDFPIRVHGVFVPFTDSAICLGVELDVNLSWRGHVSTILNKLRLSVKILHRLRSLGLSTSLLLRVYRSLFESHLLYCIAIWGSASSTLECLRTSQNAALRAVFGLGFRDRVDSLRAQHRIMTVDLLYTWRISVLAYRSCFGLLPPALSSTFASPHAYSHSLRVPRSALDIDIAFSSTSYVQRSPLYQMSTQWNSLPAEIRASQSLCIFTRS